MEEITNENKIPVFLSIGTPHKEVQGNYRDQLKEYLESQGITTMTLNQTFYSIEAPLIPIQRQMKKVFGAAILGMERVHIIKGCSKPGSENPEKLEGQYLSTVWNHIEAAMAYQVELPLLILKEGKLFPEGIFDKGISQWTVVDINPEKPEEIKNDPRVKGAIDMWIDQVRKLYSQKDIVEPLPQKEQYKDGTNLVDIDQIIHDITYNDRYDEVITLLNEISESLSNTGELSSEFDIDNNNETVKLKNRVIELLDLFKEIEDQHENE